MADAFVPLLPFGPGFTEPKASSYRMKIMLPESPAQAFVPLQVTEPAPPAALSPAHACAGASTETQPIVTLQREGDRITHIRIQCSCGQVMELACSYIAG